MSNRLKFPNRVLQFDEETVLERWGANHTQSSRRAVGGHLYLTTQRVIFEPHGLDAALEGSYWWAMLDRISDVGRQKRDFSQPLGGSFRDRLKIVLNDGTEELFVLNKLDTIIERIGDRVVESGKQ